MTTPSRIAGRAAGWLLLAAAVPSGAAAQAPWAAGPEISWSQARSVGVGARGDARISEHIRAYLQGVYYFPGTSDLVEPSVDASRKRVEMNLNVVREPERWRGWLYLGGGVSWEWRSLDVTLDGLHESVSSSDWAANVVAGLRRPGPGWVPHVEVKRELWRLGWWVVTAGASVPVG